MLIKTKSYECEGCQYPAYGYVLEGALGDLVSWFICRVYNKGNSI